MIKFKTTKMSHEYYFLDVNPTAGHFLKTPELCEVDRRDRDCSWKNIKENTLVPSSRSPDFGNSFPTDVLRVVAQSV